MKTFTPNTLTFFLLFLLSSAASHGSPVFPTAKNKPFPHSHIPLKPFFDNQPPVLTATGNQIFCPGSPMKIVTDVTITARLAESFLDV